MVTLLDHTAQHTDYDYIHQYAILKSRKSMTDIFIANDCDENIQTQIFLNCSYDPPKPPTSAPYGAVTSARIQVRSERILPMSKNVSDLDGNRNSNFGDTSPEMLLSNGDLGETPSQRTRYDSSDGDQEPWHIVQVGRTPTANALNHVLAGAGNRESREDLGVSCNTYDFGMLEQHVSSSPTEMLLDTQTFTITEPAKDDHIAYSAHVAPGSSPSTATSRTPSPRIPNAGNSSGTAKDYLANTPLAEPLAFSFLKLGTSQLIRETLAASYGLTPSQHPFELPSTTPLTVLRSLSHSSHSIIEEVRLPPPHLPSFVRKRIHLPSPSRASAAAHALASLSHPHIATLLAAYDDSTHPTAHVYTLLTSPVADRTLTAFLVPNIPGINVLRNRSAATSILDM